jgi:hypothetical protein
MHNVDKTKLLTTAKLTIVICAEEPSSGRVRFNDVIADVLDGVMKLTVKVYKSDGLRETAEVLLTFSSCTSGTNSI